MILDSSAIIAIVKKEPDARAISERIESELNCKASAATFVESAIVVDSIRDPVVSRRLEEIFQESEIAIVPFDENQARIAREAYRDFGKGSGHPARLNFGDCFAYALAKALDEPLLYKGADFSHTDVRPALP